MQEEILLPTTVLLSKKEYVQNHFILNMTHILAPEYYFDIFESLRNSSQNDLLELRLSSPGGRVDSGMIFYNIIKENFKGRNIAYIDSTAISMAALLFLACEQRIIYPHSILMLHDMSTGLDGKANEIVNHIKAHKESYQIMFNRVCKDFLTKKEIKLVDRGVDLYLSASDMCRKGIADFVIFDGETLSAKDYLAEVEKHN